MTLEQAKALKHICDAVIEMGIIYLTTVRDSNTTVM